MLKVYSIRLILTILIKMYKNDFFSYGKYGLNFMGIAGPLNILFFNIKNAFSFLTIVKSWGGGGTH